MDYHRTMMRITLWKHLAVATFLAILAVTNTPITEAYRNGWSAKPVAGGLPFELYLVSIWKAAAIISG